VNTENTEIRIEATREISSAGGKGYQITQIHALPKKELPDLYLKNGPVVYSTTECLDGVQATCLRTKENGRSVFFDDFGYVVPRFYTCEDIEKILAHIRAAGQHLMEVNAHLAKERAKWNDEVTFVDGVEVKETGAPSPVVEKIAELWASGKLYCRDDKGKFRKI